VKMVKFYSFCTLIAALILVPVLHAGAPPKMPADGPIPPQIAAAQKVFISNAGGATFEAIIDETVFNGGPDRPYNEFYSAMKGWGRYALVSSPADADLVFEVSWTLSDTGLKLPVLGQLRMVVIDPKTRITVWNFTEYVRGAILQGNRDKNFSQAMSTIMARLKSVAVAPSAAGDAASK
jgi:hypothetical protein